jgi:hypothetical protein
MQPQEVEMWRRFQSAGARNRAVQRDRAIVDAQRIGDIKWQWRQACELSGLGQLVFTPSGPAMAIPMIGQVSLGPPTSFTVRLRPGQLPSAVQQAEPQIAEAMSAAGIVVTRLPAEWVRIELIPVPAHPIQAGSSDVLPFSGPSRVPRGNASRMAA